MSLSRAALGKLAFVSTCAALLLSGFGPGTPRLARAQEGSAISGPLDKMKALNHQAVLDYAAQDFESAQLGLREAIAMGQRAGMGSDPFMARLLANLGAVFISGLKDEKRGSRALESALALEPDIKLTDTLATPALREVFSRLQSRVQKTEPGGRPRTDPVSAPGNTPGNSPVAPVSPSPPRSIEGSGPAPAFPPAAPPAAARSSEPDARPPTATVAIVPAPPPSRRREAGEEPDLPARVPQPLYCPTPDEAPPSQRITLHCVLQPEVNASKVLLYYRPPGARRFTSTSTVRSSKGWYRGIIPGEVVQGRSLHFYFEARDNGDEVVGSAGRDDSPNVVIIRVGAPTAGRGLYAGVGSRRLSGDDPGATRPEEEDPLLALAERERQAAAGRRRPAGTPFFGLGLGSGYGYHGTQRLEFYPDAIIEKGWIPSGLVHLTPEIGYQWNENFALSLLARLQFISQSGSGDMRAGNPARGAYAILARPQLLLGPGNLQFNLSGYVGAGDGFRLTVAPQPPTFRRNDSVRGGPLVAGPGVGLLFHFSRHLAAAFDGRWLFGFPDFATVADLGLNIQIAF